MKTSTFKMEIQLTIRRVDMEDGREVGSGYQDRLALTDTVDLGPRTLLETLELMGKMHALLAKQAVGQSQYEKDCEKAGVNALPDDELARLGYCVNAMCSKHFGGPQDWQCKGKPYPYVNHP